MRSSFPQTLPACAILVLLAGAGLSPPAYGQPRYPLLWDPALSSETGAENLATARRGLMALVNRVLPLRWSDESTPAGKALGVTYRLGRAFFLERPLTLTAWLVQHEVFGHGAGARHAGVRGTTYEISLPWPYGPGPSGRAFYPAGSRFSQFEDLHTSSKGANASIELARTVRDRAVRRGALFYDEVTLGITGHLDLPLYILGTQDRGDRGDVATYLRLMDGSPTLESLKRKAWIGLADPFTLLALGASLRHHLWGGRRRAPLPVIEWKSIRYLPSLHLSLSPFGPEFLLEHLAVHDGRLWRLTTRIGDGPYGRFGGAGIEVTGVTQTGRLRTDVRLDVWYQPTLLLSETIRPARLATRRAHVDLFALGVRAEVSASVRPTPQWPVFATGTLGYKTEGFVLGEGLDAGVLVELGLRLDASLLE